MQIIKLYIARDSDCRLYLYNEEPRKDKQNGIWHARPLKDSHVTGQRFEFLSLPNSWFSDVKWKDEKATEVTLTALVKQKEIFESKVEVSKPVGNGDCHRDCRNCTGELVCPGNIND